MGPEDDTLMDDLLAQLDSKNQTVQQESAKVLNGMILEERAKEMEPKPKPSAKDRFQARLARKAAAIAQTFSPDDPEGQAHIEKEARDEEEAINKVCKKHGRQILQINPDGHCLYSAVADQLALLGKLLGPQATYVTTRAVAANYIESHPDDFLPFLPSTEGEDSAGATDPGLMSPQQFQQYCQAVRDSAVWGGEPEIQALSRAFNVPIYVVQGGVPPVVAHHPSGNPEANKAMKEDGVWISYHRRMYRLGEVRRV